MHVDTARSVLASSGRWHERPAEPWGVPVAPPEDEGRRQGATVSSLERLTSLVMRWLS